jgi:hypothetical protein
MSRGTQSKTVALRGVAIDHDAAPISANWGFSRAQVPTVQLQPRYQFKANPGHPASNELFATVAALQHLCDEHDMYHVSPPPIWPMILHGAMDDPFGGDDINLCLGAIVNGNDVTIRLAVQGAIRVLEGVYQRHGSLAPVPSAQDALNVCMQALESDKDSGDALHRKIRLVGLLSYTVRGLQLGGCCAALITAVSRAKDERVRETCTAAIFDVCCVTVYATLDMPLLDELRGLLKGKLHPVVDPAAARLLMRLADKPGFAELRDHTVSQLLRRGCAQTPVELWFAAALLAPNRESSVHALGLSRIPFEAALQYLDGPPEVAEPAAALFGGLARLGWSEHAALKDDVLKRMPRLLTQGDAALCVGVVSCLQPELIAHDVRFFVESLLPVLLDLAAAPLSEVPPSRCPFPLRSPPLPPDWVCVPTAAVYIIAGACDAHPEAIVPALLEAPQLPTFVHILAAYYLSGTETTSGSRKLAELSLRIVSILLAGDGYERVVRAVGVDTWHQLTDHYAALPKGTWKVALGMTILEHEDMERCLHALKGLRHCVTGLCSKGSGGLLHPTLDVPVSLRHAAKILACCASADDRTADGWTILHALIHAAKNADGAIAAMMHAQQHVLMAALQHPSPDVRLAALRCAAALVSAATFPRTDRLAFVDVLVRCLRDMRVEAQAAAGPSLDRSRLDGRDASNDRPREVEYGFSFRAVATLWRFDEGENRWTGGAEGTAKVLTHRSLASSLLFVFRDAEEKLAAYHRLTPDTQLTKTDDVTWEWRVAKDYADDDEGFPEQFKLSLQSAEDASRFQRHVAPSHHDKAATAFGVLSASSITAQRDSVSVDDNAAVRNPFLTAFPQRPIGQAQGSNNPFATPSAGSPPPPTSNPFASYSQRMAATGGFVVGAQVSPPLEGELGAAARKALVGYSYASQQTYIDAVLRATTDGPAKNVRCPASDERTVLDDEYRLTALGVLYCWCDSDVTSEPAACCPVAQRLVENGGATEIALIAIACYDTSTQAKWCAYVEWDAPCRSSGTGCWLMTLLQKYCRPDAIREALGEELHTTIAVLVTLYEHREITR